MVGEIYKKALPRRSERGRGRPRANEGNNNDNAVLARAPPDRNGALQEGFGSVSFVHLFHLSMYPSLSLSPSPCIYTDSISSVDQHMFRLINMSAWPGSASSCYFQSLVSVFSLGWASFGSDTCFFTTHSTF